MGASGRRAPGGSQRSAELLIDTLLAAPTPPQYPSQRALAGGCPEGRLEPAGGRLRSNGRCAGPPMARVGAAAAGHLGRQSRPYRAPHTKRFAPYGLRGREARRVWRCPAAHGAAAGMPRAGGEQSTRLLQEGWWVELVSAAFPAPRAGRWVLTGHRAVTALFCK